MAPGDRLYPGTGDFASPPPPPGAFYSVKDQPLASPENRRGRRRGRSRCCCLSICLCSGLTVVLVALGIAALVFWLLVQPKVVKYGVPYVRISGINSTTASSTFDTDVAFQIMAKNPNKQIGIYYDKFHVSVQTQDVTIGDGDIPSFYQGHKNTTFINGDVKSDGVILNKGTLALLTGNNAQKVPLYMKVDGNARYKIGSFKSNKVNVKVRCTINVDLTIATGSQLLDSVCKVKS